MTSFEHALVGIDLAIAAGFYRRCGWPVVALSACAAVLPDWDGLTILLGANLFAAAHRTWGHNLLVAGLLAAVVSGLAFWYDFFPRIQRWLGARWSLLAVPDSMSTVGPRSLASLGIWILTGLLATASHFLGDLVFSSNSQLPVWGMPLLWPFSHTAWAYPTVPWGDLGATLILAAGMFAMLRWPSWNRAIASVALGAVLLYIVLRGVYP